MKSNNADRLEDCFGEVEEDVVPLLREFLSQITPDVLRFFLSQEMRQRMFDLIYQRYDKSPSGAYLGPEHRTFRPIFGYNFLADPKKFFANFPKRICSGNDDFEFFWSHRENITRWGFKGFLIVPFCEKDGVEGEYSIYLTDDLSKTFFSFSPGKPGENPFGFYDFFMVKEPTMRSMRENRTASDDCEQRLLDEFSESCLKRDREGR